MRRCAWCGVQFEGIHFCQIPSDEACIPLVVLRELEASGQLPSLVAAFDQQIETLRNKDLFNCHTVTQAILSDLAVAGITDGWQWCYGYLRGNTQPLILHSWVESDGWALDGAFLPTTLFAARAESFSSMFGPQQTWAVAAEEALLFWKDAKRLAQWSAEHEGQIVQLNQESRRSPPVLEQSKRASALWWWCRRR